MACREHSSIDHDLPLHYIFSFNCFLTVQLNSNSLSLSSPLSFEAHVFLFGHKLYDFDLPHSSQINISCTIVSLPFALASVAHIPSNVLHHGSSFWKSLGYCPTSISSPSLPPRWLPMSVPLTPCHIAPSRLSFPE